MTTHSDPIPRPEPLRTAVYARIVDRVWDGAYPPGAALTEAGLSKDLQVSRTPVREALLRLEADGVVRSTLARGFTVRPLRVTEARELYPILGALEALAVRSAPSVDAARTGRLLDLAERVATEPDPIARWRLDTDLHQSLVALAGNDSLSDMVTRLRTNLSRYEITYMRQATDRAHVDDQHRAIVRAIEAGDHQGAGDLVASHWAQGQAELEAWLVGTDG